MSTVGLLYEGFLLFEVVNISNVKETVELSADCIIFLEINNKTLTIPSRKLSICTWHALIATLLALLLQLLPRFARLRTVVSGHLWKTKQSQYVMTFSHYFGR